jgi:hypothetical protein
MVEQATLSAAQLFEFSDAARDAADYSTAAEGYRALALHPHQQVRSEARFRLALMLADNQQKYGEAAVLLRRILDEQPGGTRVRIELARMHAMLGNSRDAGRELRAVQASGLSADAEQLLRFYASAFQSRKSHGASLQLALAPDSNVNRATRSELLGTVLGELELSEDAQAQSGIGVSARTQLWGRVPLQGGAEMLIQTSAGGHLYRRRAFDDYSVAIELGPLIQSGSDRIKVAALSSWRWYGQKPFSFSVGATGIIQHPISSRAELRLEASAIGTDDRVNDLRDATSYTLGGSVDRAFSDRFGGGISLAVQRQVANDPGYSYVSLGVSKYLFRELGQTTAVLNIAYSHLKADRRLSLYTRTRADHRLNLSLAGTFRALRVRGFAPLLRAGYERNFSTLQIYDYRRLFGEFGVTAAF